jgi:beta-lactamase superfamily II metal-dependent hydrolase
LDLHQIHTGRGNALWVRMPDGTSLLVDAGEVPDARPLELGPRLPDASRSAGAWIADYIRAWAEKIDYLLITHYHDDHMGGVGDVAGALPIGTWLDRGEDPTPPDYPAMRRYRELRAKHRGRYEAFVAGRLNQIRSKDDSFEIRNVAVNGDVWTGRGEASRSVFPGNWRGLARDVQPNENHFSAAFRIRYGAFDYFMGADLIGVALDGLPAWHDIETPIAKVVGPVDAMALNHHGWLDTTNDFFLATLNPRVAVLPSWHASHPDHSVLRRLQSPRGPRPDLFATALLEAPKAIFRYLGNAFQYTDAHIVIRVAPGGASYSVIALDATSPERRVKAVFGPYVSR